MTIKLSGWKARAAIAVVVGLVVAGYITRSKALESQGVEAVKHWLVVDAARAAVPDLKEAMSELDGRREAVERAVHNLRAEHYEVLSVTRHGLGESMVARVTYRFKAQNGSAQPRVRYLRMRYGDITGWTVVHETSAWVYYLSLF